MSHPTNLQLTTTRIEIYCRLSEFLLFANDKYLDNPYHNALHGADAALTMYYFLEAGKLRSARAVKPRSGVRC